MPYGMEIAMNAQDKLSSFINVPARWLDLLQPLMSLATRWYVSWQFLKSGWLKISDWSTTLDLFRSEYHVPVLPPTLAAVTGTFGELFFPVLLVLGIGGRFGALGLFAVNVMAVVSYSHVLLSEGFEAALGQHVLWGFMLAMLAIYGNGALSLDRLLLQRRRHGNPVGMSLA
jgi:putative oxidoreductase